MAKQIKRRREYGAAVGALVVVGAIVGGASAAGAGNHTSFHGVFSETAAGADEHGYDIHGSAKMTISANGTVVRVNVSGLDPSKSYGSHLHNDICARGGGDHYQDDDSASGATTPPNELWLTTNGSTLAPNPGGVAHGNGSAEWQARTSSEATNARSVVVHEPGGLRIACADLR